MKERSLGGDGSFGAEAAMVQRIGRLAEVDKDKAGISAAIDSLDENFEIDRASFDFGRTKNTEVVQETVEAENESVDDGCSQKDADLVAEGVFFMAAMGGLWKMMNTIFNLTVKLFVQARNFSGTWLSG